MPDAAALPTSPLHALCVYAEPLVVGRRVVVFGSATDHLGERLLDLGARIVHVYDPRPERAASYATSVAGGADGASSARGLTVRPLPAGELDVRDGAFDAAIVPDLADLDSPTALLARVRRLLSPGGTAIIGARNAAVALPLRGRASTSAPRSIDYYELYDLVALQFAHIRMVGQLPWRGVLLAELGLRGDDGASVSVDTQLGGDADAPEAFFAVASQDDVRLGEYSLIQLPGLPPTAGPMSARIVAGDGSLDLEATMTYGADRADLAAAQLRANLLEAQLDELRGQRNAEGAARAEAVGGLEAELAERLSLLHAAEGRARDAVAKAAETVVELRARDEEMARVRDRAALQWSEIDEERRLRARAEIELAVSRRSAEAAAAETRVLLAALERVPDLEVALAAVDARALELASRLVEAEEARGLAHAAMEAALLDVEAARRETARSSAEDVDALARRAASGEARAAVLEAEVAALRDGREEDHAADVAIFENALRERAQIIHALEHELARRERIILDLVHALEEARLASGGAVADLADAARLEELRAENHELHLKLDALAMDVARREGDAATSAWRVQELEREIGRLDAEQTELTMTIPPPAFLRVEREANDVTRLADRLSQAEDQVELLRQALAQEHEARARAESGDELARAREDLARQATLLEQLSRELDARDRAPTQGTQGTQA